MSRRQRAVDLQSPCWMFERFLWSLEVRSFELVCLEEEVKPVLCCSRLCLSLRRGAGLVTGETSNKEARVCPAFGIPACVTRATRLRLSGCNDRADSLNRSSVTV
jgi:hypothetical protein